uniref:Neurotransmitter-gated ion-channel ligand-binding domain-containing protein n=1 Tax=Alexandrium monilatum TaxID=311494 RepID=A0A7S4Q8F6_9DINO
MAQGPGGYQAPQPMCEGPPSEDVVPLLGTADMGPTYREDPVDEPATRYISRPKPPKFLWDTSDHQYLELVRCHAAVRVVSLDPKAGTFSVRMKCHWAFRTLNSQEDSEIRLRGVPGIRMPANRVTVEESRVWKDLTGSNDPASKRTTHKTVYWKGTSTFTIEGHKVFHMENFPFDRQVINLEQLDFVWRSEKDEADYYKSMKVVFFNVSTESLLPEWSVEPAYITPMEKTETRPVDLNCPSFAHKFVVQLRIERKEWFYVRQVFFVTYLMVLVSCTPLTMPPTEDNMGTRLEVYGSSLLTLVAFKYAVAEHLPSVPYGTFTDDFLIAPVVTVSLCVFETVASFHFVNRIDESVTERLDWGENISFYMLALLWTIYFLYAAFYKPRRRTPWLDVLARKSQNRWTLRHSQDMEFFERECESSDTEDGEDSSPTTAGEATRKSINVKGSPRFDTGV